MTTCPKKRGKITEFKAQVLKRAEQDGVICSMSRRGNCYDNAVMESWHHSLKVEAIHGERFATRQSTKEHVFEYIEIYYNW